MEGLGGSIDPFDLFFFKGVQATEVVHELINKIIDDGAQELYNHTLLTRAVPFSAKMATNAILSTMDICFMKHELGEETLSDWELEEEPVPAPLDTWARGVIPTRKKVRPFGVDSRVTSAATRPNLTGGFNGAGFLSSHREFQPPIPTFDSNPRALPPPLPTDPKEEALREEKEREIRRRKEEEARLKKKKRRDNDLATQQALLRQTRKDRDCAFDSAGNIILVSKPDVNNLPDTVLVPEYKVKQVLTPEEIKAQQILAEEAAKAAAKGKRSGGWSSSSTSPLANMTAQQLAASLTAAKKEEEATTRYLVPKTNLPPHISSFVSKLAGQQPPLLDALEPIPGVTVAEGSKVKQGADTQVTTQSVMANGLDSMTVSKAEYDRLLAGLAADGGSFETVGGGSTQQQDVKRKDKKFSLSFNDNDNDNEGIDNDDGTGAYDGEGGDANEGGGDYYDDDGRLVQGSIMSVDELPNATSASTGGGVLKRGDALDALMMMNNNNGRNGGRQMVMQASPSELFAQHLASVQNSPSWGVHSQPDTIHRQALKPDSPSKESKRDGSPEKRRVRGAMHKAQQIIAAAQQPSPALASAAVKTSSTLQSAGLNALQTSSVAAAAAAAALNSGASLRIGSLAPPPYGATMGHGLLEAERDNYYFPPVDSILSAKKDQQLLAATGVTQATSGAFALGSAQGGKAGGAGGMRPDRPESSRR